MKIIASFDVIEAVHQILLLDCEALAPSSSDPYEQEICRQAYANLHLFEMNPEEYVAHIDREYLYEMLKEYGYCA